MAALKVGTELGCKACDYAEEAVAARVANAEARENGAVQ